VIHVPELVYLQLASRSGRLTPLMVWIGMTVRELHISIITVDLCER
jgi:hypothetical protein